jgi:hypothetical protein
MSDSETTPSAGTTAPAGRARWRSIAAAICVVLAALLTVPAGIAYWGQRTLNDGQRYLDTVGPLVESPKVQEAISRKAIDAIERQVDVEALLNEAFAARSASSSRRTRSPTSGSGSIPGPSRPWCGS